MPSTKALFFSIIIPIYNRPDELTELLESLRDQTYSNFEVLVIDDGSSIPIEPVVVSFQNSESHFPIQYYFKENGGQGFARNYGFERATGDYMIVVDSDVLIPSQYLQEIVDFLKVNPIDAFGGPDAAHPNFTLIQRAISQSMTSFITTGGIRGKAKSVSTYHPRSFNMGITKEVFEKTGGYDFPFKGEDIDFSIRIINQGFKTGLIQKAFIYHKRRATWSQFFRQTRFFGSARVFIEKLHPSTAKVLYKIPSIFLIGLIVWLSTVVIAPTLFKIGGIALGGLTLAIFFEALFNTKSVSVSILSIVASYTQLIGYGLGYLEEKFLGKSGAGHHSPEK